MEVGDFDRSRVVQEALPVCGENRLVLHRSVEQISSKNRSSSLLLFLLCLLPDVNRSTHARARTSNTKTKGSVPQIVTAKEQQASDARALQLLMESMERFAADIGTVDDTVCRTCHIVDHFDGFGYPVTATSPSVALHPLPPLSATSPADFSAARSIQQKKLRLALNSYRFVTRQPQSLPGQRQRAAKNQLIAQREASSAEGVPPQPQRLPPRPLSQSERQSEQQQQQQQQHQQPQRPRTQVIK